MEQDNMKQIPPLDSMVQDRQLQMLKAAVPYITEPAGKNMAFFIRFLELHRTMSLFEQPQTTIQMCSTQEKQNSSVQMLEALRDYCTPQEQEQIDMIMNYMQMFSQS